MMKKLEKYLIVVISIVLMMSTAYALDDEQTTTFLLSKTTYEEPEYEMPSDSSSLLLSKEQIENMTQREIVAFLTEKIAYDPVVIEQLAAYLKSEDYNNGIATTYGIYEIPEWYVEPYILDSYNYAVVNNEWIAIDAYTSSVGMSKSSSSKLQVSVKLSYTGSKEIKEKKSLTAEGTIEHSITIGESVTCPAWHYVAWRPYIVYREDAWRGIMEVTTVIPTATGVSQYTRYDNLEGTHQTLVAKATQAFSRENKDHDINAASPVPPLNL